MLLDFNPVLLRSVPSDKVCLVLLLFQIVPAFAFRRGMKTALRYEKSIAAIAESFFEEEYHSYAVTQ